MAHTSRTRSHEEVAPPQKHAASPNRRPASESANGQAAGDDAVALLACADVAVLLLDDALRVERFTMRAAELFGLSPGDIGRALRDISPRFKDRSLLEECERVLEDHLPAEKEVWIETERNEAAAFPGGSLHGPSPRCCLRRIRPCPLPDGRLGIAILLVDITDRIRSEAEMRRLIAMLRESSDAMIAYDLDGQITAWNRGAEQMYGYRESEVLGMNLADIVPKNFRSECVARIRSLIGVDRIDSFEMQRLTKDGRILDVWINATWLTDEAGKRTAFVTAERDVTDRKRHLQTLKSLANILEDQVASRTEALKRNEAKLRAIVNSVADAIVTIDKNGAIGTFNRSAERIFGCLAQEIIGKNITRLLALSQRDDRELIEFLHTGVNNLRGASREVLGQRNDGSTFAIELAVGELSDGVFSAAQFSEGELSPAAGQHSTILIRDISERNELRRQVLEIAEEEQRRIGQDLHDGTQQELCGLGMIAENLFESLEADRALEHAKIARRLSQGLGRALENVRRLSRGLVPVEIGAHGVRAALAELAVQTSASCGVACRFDCDDGPAIRDPSVATHLYRIAQEAVTNVVKHARAGEILLSLETGRGVVTLKVSDDGLGIAAPPEPSGGLGLKVMFYRAGMIGGSLRVQRRERGGTEVICTVPLERR